MRKTLFVMTASASLLVACGGGGGSVVDTPVVPSSAATVALSGTAAKGLMANADVGVFAVNADGSVAGTALATTTTGADGKYSLSFTGTKDQPYVVRVSAKADGSTSHADEVSGLSQPLPAGFSMRSLVVPSTTGAVTASASITPFSEMAVAAAAKASGGITAVNAAQAVSTVSQLLGFNPTTVTATTLAGASGAEQQKLAVMLTAVSQLAASSDLGCSTGSAGQKTQCVVAALGAAASKDSIKLGDSANDVSAKLAGAVTTVMSSDAVRDKVDAATLTNVIANLGCTTSCTAAAVGTTPAAPSATALGIASAKLLFTEIKTDWSAMFSSGSNSSIAGGAVNIEANKFQATMQGVKVPVEMLAKDLGALLLGVDLYNDYKAGRTTVTGRGRGDGSQVSNDGSIIDSQTSAAGCTLYQDADANVVATSTANANFIGCAARFYVTRSVANGTTIYSEWRHGFTLTPASDGSFSYLTRARKRVNTCAGNGCTLTSNTTLQLDASGAALPAFTGKLTPVLSASLGSITGFTLAGELPAAFKPGSTELVGHKHVISVSGTKTYTAAKSGSSALQGTLTAMDKAGATVTTLTIKPGSSLSETPVSFDANFNIVRPESPAAVSSAGGTLSAATLNLMLTTAGAEFEGQFSLTDSVWDKSGSVLWPSKARLSGALRNLAGGSSTEFLKGVFSVDTSGYAGFQANQPRTASNTYTLNASFVGSFSASSRPTLEFSLGSSWTDAEAAADLAARLVTLQYRTLRAGVPKLVVSVTGERNGSGNYLMKLTEAASGLSMAWTGKPTTVDLLIGGSTKIGSLSTSNGLLTFVDGSFMSLDIGL